MAAFGTGAYGNEYAAVNALINASIAAGYTPDSDIGADEIVTAVVASFLNDAIPLPAGTVTAPALATTGDSNTGIYFSAADKVDVAAGGVRAARFNGAATGVNFLDFTAAAAASNPTIAAAGADTNISLALAGKGTGGITVGGGTPIAVMRRISATLTPAAIAANTALEETFTSFTGLTTNDAACYVQKPTAQGGLGIVGVRVVTTNNLGITFANVTGSAITPTAGQVYTVFTTSLGTDD